MAEYKLSITADETIEKLIFAGKEYINTLGKTITMQLFENHLEIDEELLEDEELLKGIDDISSMNIFGIRVILERLEEYEK